MAPRCLCVLAAALCSLAGASDTDYFGGASSAHGLALHRLAESLRDLATTEAPTAAPTAAPTSAPTNAPTSVPTSAPSAAPAERRLDVNDTYFGGRDAAEQRDLWDDEHPEDSGDCAPTPEPSCTPEPVPSCEPTPPPETASAPDVTTAPTSSPTSSPTVAPTSAPSSAPSAAPAARRLDDDDGETYFKTYFAEAALALGLGEHRDLTDDGSGDCTPTPEPAPSCEPTPTPGPEYSPAPFARRAEEESQDYFKEVAGSERRRATDSDSHSDSPSCEPTPQPSCADPIPIGADATGSPTASPTSAPTTSPTSAPSVAPTAMPVLRRVLTGDEPYFND
ncbi:hypothetical protein JKP88DRAFT_353343 [Tribonema minus]|uniref:Uncharacterized protein n=1 Tax=Tribonema minus TaxID=303371 RepID=A0A835ZAM7_9STRA|nr:hypothetical protein JKP88DRAFT_353343 [Tribonema minus]